MDGGWFYRKWNTTEMQPFFTHDLSLPVDNTKKGPRWGASIRTLNFFLCQPKKGTSTSSPACIYVAGHRSQCCPTFKELQRLHIENIKHSANACNVWKHFVPCGQVAHQQSTPMKQAWATILSEPVSRELKVSRQRSAATSRHCVVKWKKGFICGAN